MKLIVSILIASAIILTYYQLKGSGIKKGDRFTVINDIKVNGLTVWGAPYTGGFECTLPKGTVLVAPDKQVKGAKGFSVVPENYKEMESILVPKKDRENQKYGGYYFVFLNSDIGLVITKN